MPTLLLGAVCLLFSGLGLAATEENEAGKLEVAANSDTKVEAPALEAGAPGSPPPPAIPVDTVILGVIGGAALIGGSSGNGGDTTTTTTTTTTP